MRNPRLDRPAGLLLGLLLLFAVVACDEATQPAEPRSSGKSEALPDLGIAGLDGTITSLQALHPGKALVLNVWATWCAPCRAELPSLQRLSDKLDQDRFAVVGLSVDRDPDFVREYLRDIGITFANYVAADHGTAPAQLGIERFPHTLLVRADGSIDRSVVGSHTWDGPAQWTAVNRLWPKQ